MQPRGAILIGYSLRSRRRRCASQIGKVQAVQAGREAGGEGVPASQRYRFEKYKQEEKQEKKEEKQEKQEEKQEKQEKKQKEKKEKDRE